MQMFLISYDLAAPTQNKNAMTSAIMMLGQSWARPLEQTWYIKADVEAGDIEQVLGRLLGDDDGLLVQSVADEAIMANTQLRWFKQRTQPLAGIDSNVVAFPAANDETAPLADDMAPISEAA